MQGLDAGTGLRILGVLALAGPLVGLVIAQIVGWDAVWDAWVAEHFTGSEKEALNLLPTVIILSQLLVTLAMAGPVELAIRRRRPGK